MKIAAFKKREEIRNRFRSRSIRKRYCNAVTPLHDVTTENKASKEGGEKALSHVRPSAFSVLSLFVQWGGTSIIDINQCSKRLSGKALSEVAIKTATQMQRKQAFSAHFGGEHDEN